MAKREDTDVVTLSGIYAATQLVLDLISSLCNPGVSVELTDWDVNIASSAH